MIAGPYRSGPGNDPQKIAANVQVMESFALPMAPQLGDKPFNETFHPIAERLLEKCDGVLRVDRDSRGADQMVEIALQKGLKIYIELKQIPPAG